MSPRLVERKGDEMIPVAAMPTHPFDRTEPFWLDRSLYPFASRFVEINGQRLHYVDEGAGPVLLFVTGLPGWSFMYRDVIRGLRERFRCVALDLPGHGPSAPPRDGRVTLAGFSALIERFVETLGLEQITLVAHGYGGPLGLGVVARRPEWFRGLVIANTFAWPLSGVPTAGRMIGFMASPVGRALLVNANLMARAFPRFGTRRRLSPAELRGYVAPYTAGSTRRVGHALFRAVRDGGDYLGDLELRLGEASAMPVLLVWGTEDFGYTLGFVERFAGMFPDSHCLIIDGGRHYAPEEAAPDIVAAIADWFPRHPRRHSAA